MGNSGCSRNFLGRLSLLAGTLIVALVGIVVACFGYLRPVRLAGGLELHEFNHGRILVSAMSEGPQAIVHDFSVQNGSRVEPLRLTRVQASCGCLETEVPESIAPGGHGHVRLGFHPRLQLEERVEYVLFATNQSEKKLGFRVTASMLPIIHFASPSTFPIAPPDSAAGEIRIMLHEPSSGYGPFTLTATQSDVALREISRTRSRLDRRFTRHDLIYSIELSGERLRVLRDSGRVPVEVVAALGDEKVVRQFEFVTVVPVRADPPSLFVRRCPKADAATITLSADVNFLVQAIKPSSPELDVQAMASAPSLAQHLSVAVRPDSTARFESGTAGISESAITVWTVTAEGEPLAAISIPVFLSGPTRSKHWEPGDEP